MFSFVFLSEIPRIFLHFSYYYSLIFSDLFSDPFSDLFRPFIRSIQLRNFKFQHYIARVHRIFRFYAIINAKFAHILDSTSPGFHIASPKKRIRNLRVVLF